MLVVAGLTYLIAGAPCAGVAKLALVFLATGNSDAVYANQKKVLILLKANVSG